MVLKNLATLVLKNLTTSFLLTCGLYNIDNWTEPASERGIKRKGFKSQGEAGLVST